MGLPTEEQFIGCLIGQSLGDALGFVVEGSPPKICRRYVEEISKQGHFKEKGRGPFPLGQYSDDSQLARELFISYVSCQRFDPEDYAGRIRAIFAEGRIVGPGRATSEAARRLAQGISWQESGTPAPSAGNGSAMRAAPIGLFFFDDSKGLIRAAHDQGRITHQDSRCSAGAVAIARAVSLVLDPKPIQRDQFLSQLSECAGSIEESVGSYILELRRWVLLEPEKAAASISRAGIAPGDSEPWEGISPFVISSVLWSLYSFLRSPEDYWKTICTAIAAGGDVDTTAAMAGAISGAHLGVEAVPAELAQRLTDQEAWGHMELTELAQKCYQVKMTQLK